MMNVDPDQIDWSLLAQETAAQLGQEPVSSQLVLDTIRTSPKMYVAMPVSARQALIAGVDAVLQRLRKTQEQIQALNHQLDSMAERNRDLLQKDFERPFPQQEQF